MLGENIRKARQAKGLSQEALGEQLHVVRQTVSKWEKGLSVPDADLLVQLATVLEVSATDLMGEDAVPSKSMEELALQSALLNEQVALQARRLKGIVSFAKRAAVAAVLIVVALAAYSCWERWHTYTYTSPLMCVEYELDGKDHELGIWLDAMDNTQVRGFYWDEGGGEIFTDADGALIFEGFMLRPGGVNTALHAAEVAIENAGGTVTAVRAE